MGFKENPFSKFSAEEEIAYIDNIFYAPKYFNTILNDISSNNSRYIFGERGSGKSALMYKLINEVKQNQGVLTVLIDQYSYLMAPGNEIKKRYYVFLIKHILNHLVQELLTENADLSHVDKVQKEKLSFMVRNFYKTISKTEVKKFREVHKIKKAVNSMNPVMNQILSGAVAMSSDLIAKSFGLPVQYDSTFYREYVPSFKIDSDEIDLTKTEEEDLFRIYEELVGIVRAIGFKNIVIFFDKIDEEPQIASSIDGEVKLLLPILLNNKLLLSGRHSFVFVLWAKVKEELNQNGVRFDKIKPLDVSWNTSELMSIMERRIKYFSDGRLSLNALFEDPKNLDLIVKLANGSPRDFLHIMSNIYDVQEEEKTHLAFFSKNAVSRGITQFLSKYDFYSVYQKKKGRREDIKNIIMKLKQIGKVDFRIKDMMGTFKVTQPACISNIKIWKNYGVVEEKDGLVGKELEYHISDPKVEHIVRYNITLE